MKKIRCWQFWKWESEIARLQALLNFAKNFHSADLLRLEKIEAENAKLKGEVSFLKNQISVRPSPSRIPRVKKA